MEPPIREVPTDPPAPPPPILDGQLHLLGGLNNDDTSSYRRREAAWVSLTVHAVLLLVLIFMPKWLPNAPLLVPVEPKQDVTFLPTPDSSAKIKPPKTNVISTQNQKAQTRLPNKETLRKLLDAERPGPPKVSAPPQPEQAPPQVAQAQPAPQQQQGTQSPPAQPQDSAKLQAPPQPKQNPFAIASAGSAVDQAIRNAANNPVVHSSTSFGSGHYGSGLHPKVDTAGNFDILSDTLGVDFGPYLQRLKHTVQEHWDPLIPESALPPMMKKGRLIVEFAIMKDGTIQSVKVVSGSGDVALDTAALGALKYSNPLPHLPVQFSGDYLLIRAAFYYNPDKNDFE